MENRLITIDPEILGGTPVFSGTRVPLQNLFDYLEEGESLVTFLEDFPSVSKEQVLSLLGLANKMVINSSKGLHENFA